MNIWRMGFFSCDENCSGKKLAKHAIAMRPVARNSECFQSILDNLDTEAAIAHYTRYKRTYEWTYGKTNEGMCTWVDR